MKTMIKTCKACGGKISKRAPACPHCGHRVTNAARMGLIVVVILLLAVGLGAGYFEMISRVNEETDRIERELRKEHEK